MHVDAPLVMDSSSGRDVNARKRQKCTSDGGF